RNQPTTESESGCSHAAGSRQISQQRVTIPIRSSPISISLFDDSAAVLTRVAPDGRRCNHERAAQSQIVRSGNSIMLATQDSIMKTTVRRGAVVVLLVLSAACGGSGPTSPTGTSQPPAPSPVPPPPSAFPPLSGPSRTFIFDREVSDPVRDYTKASRFVL